MPWTKEKAREYAKNWYLANREVQLERAKQRHKKHPEKRQASWRKCRLKTYGLTPEDYQAMAADQGHACAICGLEDWASPRGLLYVDHDHSTGDVRGLLCNGCNQGLGSFRDSPVSLASAIAYLASRK